MRAVAASAVRLPPVARVAPLTWAVVESAVAPGLALLARDATALQGEVAVSPTLRVALVRPGGHLAFRRSPGAGVSVVVCHGGPRVTETRAFEWTDDHDGLGATGTRDSGDAVQVPADAWWRVEPLGDAPVVVVHATHGPAMWVSHADHGSLPFFVYGTLRAGYRNHAVHLAGRPGVEVRQAEREEGWKRVVTDEVVVCWCRHVGTPIRHAGGTMAPAARSGS